MALQKFALIPTYRSFKPGSRDIVAGLIRRYCPSNFFPFNLAIAMGIAGFHGPAIRALTSGQAPVIMLMSEDDGKAQVITHRYLIFGINAVQQGKSATGKGVLFLVSDRKNKISPSTDSRTVLKVKLWCCRCTCFLSINVILS